MSENTFMILRMTLTFTPQMVAIPKTRKVIVEPVMMWGKTVDY